MAMVTFTKKEKLMLAVLLIAVAGMVSGCAGTYTKQDTGTAIGAVTGGALAYGLGQDSSNKEIWTVLGIGVGAMLGSNIGAQLDERDRLLAGQTMQQTLELGPDRSQGTWNNPNTGNSGTVVPTATHIASTGQPCREFITTVKIGGSEQQGYGTACRQADGSWKIVQ
jgi:surface antigen|tara:strand:- start:858 stop:1358 length:501 start_codon:yes stop_codon:yes gene_type:complete